MTRQVVTLIRGLDAPDVSCNTICKISGNVTRLIEATRVLSRRDNLIARVA